MVLEITTIHVHRGSRLSFEQSLPRAMAIIAEADGYLRHQIHRCTANKNHYVLLVYWREQADSLERFRESGRLSQLQSVLHRYYEMYPETQFFDCGEIPSETDQPSQGCDSEAQASEAQVLAKPR